MEFGLGYHGALPWALALDLLIERLSERMSERLIALHVSRTMDEPLIESHL